MADKVTLEVTRDGWTGKFQLSINQTDENGAGHGYRLAGPKFNGSGRVVLSREITEDDAREIRQYLNIAFPVNK